MKVIILGAGRRGIRLAKHLIQEKKSVVIIDSNQERCAQVVSKLDCLALCGSATDLKVLKEAGGESADAIIAVTDSDEVNLVACGIASSNYPKAKTIAAIRSISYLGNEGKTNKQILGIDHILNPEEEASKSLTAILKAGFFSNIIAFEDANFILFRATITQSSPFCNESLIDMKKAMSGEYIIIGIKRGDSVFTPSGDTTLEVGDEIAVMAGGDDSDTIFKELFGGETHTRVRRTITVGGTRIARYLFSNLPKSMLKRITLIEKNMDICSTFSSEFPEILTINESITDENIWDDERLNQADLIISVTENDELNIITASYAKRVGTKKSIALLKTNPNYIQFAQNMDIDVTISTTEATVDAIMKFLRGDGIKTLHSTFNGELEVYEFVLDEKFSKLGQTLSNVDLRGKCIIAGIKRSKSESFVPNGTYEFKVGDTILVACSHANYDAVMDFLK